ncbi:unnamed protein product [Prorocentrum cordatum]|uniref:Uncharacterized protein n=1 Tax=Prorocentrum cordatum TaxID=2364126 RepID=A0ABN9S131_9DINO|nr:unnamed protein product [Polarella glacialis]
MGKQVLEKRRRLGRLVTIPGVTCAGLCEVLRRLRQAPIEEEVSAHEAKAAAKMEYDREMSCSLELPLCDGGSFEPARLVQRLVEVSPALKRMFAAAPITPARPWNVILAHDEVTPGAVLRPHNRRKFVAFYISFLEFKHALRHDCCWFPLGVIRSAQVEKIRGGLSGTIKSLLRRLLLEDGNLVDGVALPLQGGPTMFFAKFAVHLGDEVALSRGLGVKGSAGIRPCLKCANVLKKGSGIAGAGAAPNRLVEITCRDRSAFICNSDEAVWGAHDELTHLQGTISKAAFVRHEKAHGINFNPDGLLADADLRGQVGPVSSLHFDWMHVYLCNGVASQEMFCFMSACQAIPALRDIYPKLERHCQADWSFPQQHRRKCREAHVVFCKARENASKEHWRSSASELLCIYPLVRHFACIVILPNFDELRDEVASLCHCFAVIDKIQRAKAGDIDASALGAAVDRHADAHEKAYGADNWKPKFHLATHIPEQVEKFDVVLDCFVVERSHLLPKMILDNQDILKGFEKAAISRVLLARLQELESFDERPGLRGGDAELSPLLAEAVGGDVVLSSSAAFKGLLVWAGDVVRMQNNFLCVAALGQRGDDLFILGHECVVIEKRTPNASVLRKDGELLLAWWSGESVEMCHAWSELASGDILALH